MDEMDVNDILNEVEPVIQSGNVERFKDLIKAMHGIQNYTILCEDYHKRGVDLISLICLYRKKKFLSYLLHQSHILHYLTPVNKCQELKSKEKAFYYAMCSGNFEILEMLYDYWCGDVHWMGHKMEYNKFDVQNLKELNILLTKAFIKYEDDSIKVHRRIDQVMLFNIQSLMAFNDFQIHLYTELNSLKDSLKTLKDKPKNIVRIEETNAIRKMIIVTIEIYENHQKIAESIIKNTVAAFSDNFVGSMQDTSPLIWKTHFYTLYEVYFPKLDFNVCLLILDNLHLLKLRLSMSKDSYQKLESKVNLFYYHVSSKWQLYLPKKKTPNVIKVSGKYKNMSCIITTKYDKNRLERGSYIIYLERRDLDKTLNNFKNELKNIDNIKEHIREDHFKLPCEENNSLAMLPELRDFCSLKRISQHIAHLYSVDVKNNKEYAFLLIERTLQVVGEFVKSSDESLHLQCSTEALVKAEISVDIINDLKVLRNMLCHVKNGELLKRIELEISACDIVESIHKELLYIQKKIGAVIKMYRPFMEKALLNNAISLAHARKNEIAITGCNLVLYMIELLEYVPHDYNKFYKEINPPGAYLKFLIEEAPALFVLFLQLQSQLTKVNKNILKNVILKFPFYRQKIKDSLEVIENNKKTWQQIIKIINDIFPNTHLSNYPNENDANKIISYCKKIDLVEESLKKIIENKTLFSNVKSNWFFIMNLLQFIVLTSGIFEDNVEQLKILAELEKLNKYDYMANDTKGIVNEYLNTIDAELKSNQNTQNLAQLCDYRGINEFISKLSRPNFLTDEEKKYLILALNNAKRKNNIRIIEISNKIKNNSDIAIPKRVYSYLIKTEEFSKKAQKILNNLVLGYKRDPLLPHCLKKRISLLQEIIKNQSKAQLVLRYKIDKTFRVLVEVILCDIFAILNSYTSDNILKKSSKLLAEINLRNILSHGSPLLEVVGNFLDSDDLPTELVTKALDIVKEERSINSLCALINSDFDITLINNDTLSPKEEALVKEFKSSTKWRHYLLLVPEYRLYIEKKQKTLKKDPIEPKDELDDDVIQNTNNLFQAVKNKDSVIVQKSIVNGAKINYIDIHGKAAIHYAAMNGNIGVLEMLLKNSADVNIKDKTGLTALHYSAMNGFRDAVELLLRNKADCIAIDNKGGTPIDYANKRKQDVVVQLLTHAMKIL